MIGCDVVKSARICSIILALAVFACLPPLRGYAEPAPVEETYPEEIQEPAADSDYPSTDDSGLSESDGDSADPSLPDSVNVDVNGFSDFVDTFESTLSNSPVSYMVSVIGDVESSPPPENSVISAVHNLFGDYHRLTYTQLIVLDDGTTVESEEYVPGLAGLDWEYLVSVSVFFLMLYCLFRLLGGIVTHD